MDDWQWKMPPLLLFHAVTSSQRSHFLEWRLRRVHAHSLTRHSLVSWTARQRSIIQEFGLCVLRAITMDGLNGLLGGQCKLATSSSASSKWIFRIEVWLKCLSHLFRVVGGSNEILRLERHSNANTCAFLCELVHLYILLMALKISFVFSSPVSFR